MTGEMRIREEINTLVNHFIITQKKCHLTKNPNSKYPKGKFYNGLILEKLYDHLRFLDDVEGPITIFFVEIADIEEYKEREIGGDGRR